MSEIKKIKKAMAKQEAKYDKAITTKEKNRIMKKAEALQRRLDFLLES